MATHLRSAELRAEIAELREMAARLTEQASSLMEKVARLERMLNSRENFKSKKVPLTTPKV
jgi:predicted  nucleic acid-binding Zn-ribbon protein